VIVGVNRYQVEEEVELPVFELDESAVDRQIMRVDELRRTRDQVAVDAALAELRAVCEGTANMMPAVISCVEAYATTGEVGSVWRDVFGEYEREVVRF
jgi:methylmalonyl-CoA mutase N-terminal domain/subunit